MNQTKQKLNARQSSSFENDEERKLQKTTDYQHKPITLFEALANETFFEIFEYLYGDDIYKAFINLNSRFERLIFCPLLMLKIRLYQSLHLDLKEFCESVIKHGKHRIISLNYGNNTIINKFFRDYPLDCLFVRLQSITISRVSIHKSLKILPSFKALPCLSSLTITINEEHAKGLPKLYRKMFSLSFLKYMKLSFSEEIIDDEFVIYVPLTKNEQLSPIEYLSIDHESTDAAIMSILRHTPQLQHLTCSKHIALQRFPLKPLLKLPKLKYIYMDGFFGDMEDFKQFIIKLSPPLEVLVLKDLSDETYLHAEKWKRFIIKRMPLLRRLEFTCDPDPGFNARFILSAKIVNQFLSPFWVERKNFFSVTYINGKFRNQSLCSYREMCLDIFKRMDIAEICNGNINDSSTKMMQLTLWINVSNELFQSFFEKLKSDIQDMLFTRLHIYGQGISAKRLVQIIHLLPNLNSLKISSTFQVESNSLLSNDEQNQSLTSINNTITTVNLENEYIINLQQIDFILDLCRRIQYLQVNIPLNLAAAILLKGILRKATSSTCNPDLNTLCFHIRNANERLVGQMDEFIKFEKLLKNYKIKRFGDDILLRWN